MAKFTKQSSITDGCKYILDGMGDNNLVIGPWVWRPSDGKSSKIWYFIVGMCDKNQNWICHQITGDDDIRAEFIHVMVGLARNQNRGLIIHSCEDEISAAKWSEFLWPGARIRDVRKRLETELDTPSQITPNAASS